jgi:HAE1 family hydrophobic/amphiphilic exporter-1
MRYCYLTFAVFMLLAVPAGRAETLSRAEAVRIALRANPEVLKTREQLNYLDGRITEEKSAALPDISARGIMYRYNDPSFLNSPSFESFAEDFGGSLKPIPGNVFEGAVEVRQTLYSFKVGRALRAARRARQLGGADLRRAQQQIALETVQAYNALLYAAEQVRVQQNALSQKEQHFQVTRNRRAAGVATELEVLRAQVSLENQRAEVTRSEGGVELARAQLNALMLRPMAAPVSPTDSFSYQPADFLPEDVIREALANRPDLQVAGFTEGVREELVGLAKAERRPSLEFVGNYGRSSRKPENFLDNDFSKWTASVNLKIPVFDGRRTAGKVAQAEAEVAKARQDKIALQNRIRLEAVNALVKLNVAARLISAAQLNVEQAQKALSMTQANYRYGAVTALEVSDAETALVEAETILAQALQQHADARAMVNYVMGRDPAAINEVPQ